MKKKQKTVRGSFQNDSLSNLAYLTQFEMYVKAHDTQQQVI